MKTSTEKTSVRKHDALEPQLLHSALALQYQKKVKPEHTRKATGWGGFCLKRCVTRIHRVTNGAQNPEEHEDAKQGENINNPFS